MVPIILFLLPATAQWSGVPSPGPEAPRGSREWHLLYQPIPEPAAREFLEKALAAGRQWLGEPLVPVREVRLRLSTPRRPGSQLRRGFRLTEVNSLEEGIFTIYVSARPGDRAFHGQLAHEVFHLFDPRYRDVYIEGLNTLLSEKLLRRMGLPWKHWEEHFGSGKDPLYGGAYRLLRRLEAVVGEAAILRLVRHGEGRATGRGQVHRAIAIDGWLDSLEPTARIAARLLILESHDRIEKHRLKSHRDYAFAKPTQPASR